MMPSMVPEALRVEVRGDCLTLISPIIKLLDTEPAKSQMFCACLLLRHTAVRLPLSLIHMESYPYVVGQKHQQQRMTCLTPYTETLKYSIHLFAVIALNQG